jgi:hypothetical protein
MESILLHLILEAPLLFHDLISELYRGVKLGQTFQRPLLVGLLDDSHVLSERTLGLLQVALQARHVRITLNLIVGLSEEDLPEEVSDLTMRLCLNSCESLLFTVPPDCVEIC